MITFEEACTIAYIFFAQDGFYGLTGCEDLGDKYCFHGYSKKIVYGGLVPITVSKKTGEVRSDLLSDYLSGVDVFMNAVEMEIPDKFQPENS